MRIFSKFLHFFILIICLLIQIVFFEYLKMFSIHFDLVMVAVVAVAFFDGTIWGILYGFIIGILMGLMVGDVVGISAFIYAIDGFLVDRLITVGFKSRWLAYLSIVFLVTEVNILMVNLIYYLFSYEINWLNMSIKLASTPFFNIILMFALFPLIRKSSGRRREIEIEL